MKRLAENQLLAWKNRSYRLPLILQGARQLGKTYAQDTLFIEESGLQRWSPEYSTLFI
jgi:predicted AAA+ superfamily ATPase